MKNETIWLICLAIYATLALFKMASVHAFIQDHLMVVKKRYPRFINIIMVDAALVIVYLAVVFALQAKLMLAPDFIISIPVPVGFVLVIAFDLMHLNFSCMRQCRINGPPDLETQMQIHQDELDATDKILLLGSGSSGKSTIFKQLQCIYGDGLEQNQINEARCISDSMDIGADKEIVAEAMEICVKACEHSFEGDNMIEDTLIAIGNAIGSLWDLELIQHTFSKRGAGDLMYSFPDNTEFFFMRVELIFVYEWGPSMEDVLQARAMTTATGTTIFAINGQMFDIIDVGGQRNERRKWIHALDDVDTVLFVAALDHESFNLF